MSFADRMESNPPVRLRCSTAEQPFGVWFVIPSGYKPLIVSSHAIPDPSSPLSWSELT